MKERAHGMVDERGYPIVVRRRKGLRTLRLSVGSDGRVTVSAARLVPMALIRRFVIRQRAWIAEHQKRFQEEGYTQRLSPEQARLRFEAHREEAHAVLAERLRVLSERIGVMPKRVTVRDMRTRWGSCSARGTLSFNYRLVFLPEHLVEYVVVHELCHLRELNHSSRFWALVESVLPDYADCRRELKKIRLAEIGYKEGEIQ